MMCCSPPTARQEMSNAPASHAFLNVSKTRNLESSRQIIELQMSLWGMCVKDADVCWALRDVATAELSTGGGPDGSQIALRELIGCAQASTSMFLMFAVIFAVFLPCTTLLAIPGRCERRIDLGQRKCVSIIVGGVSAVLGTLVISDYASQCLTMTEMRPRVGIILLLTGVVLDILGHTVLLVVPAIDVRHESNALLFGHAPPSSGYGTGDVKH